MGRTAPACGVILLRFIRKTAKLAIGSAEASAMDLSSFAALAFAEK